MSIERVQEKLSLAEANLDYWEKLAVWPRLSSQAALAARNSAHSMRAAVVLYLKALAYERAKLGVRALLTPREVRLYAALLRQIGGKASVTRKRSR